MTNSKDFASVPKTTCTTVVEWVATKLTPKPYRLWNTQELDDFLSKPKAEGGAGLSDESVVYLHRAKIDNLTLARIVTVIKEERMKGLTEEECIELATKIMTSDKDFALVPESTCKAVTEWVATKLARKADERDLQKRNEKVSSLFIAFSVNVVSFNSYILLQKDRMRISDSLYHEIRIRFFLEKYLPPLDDLKDTRKEKNIEVLGFYDVNIRSVSYVASVQHEKEQIYEDIDEPEDACEDTCQNICQDSCQNISSNPTQDNQSSNSVGVAMSMSSNVLNESPVTVKGNKKQTTVVFVKNITKLVKSILKLELIETINRQTKGKVISENDMAFLEKATKEAIMSYGMDQKGLNGLTVLGVSMRGSRVFMLNVVVIEYNGKNYKYELKNKLVTDLSAFKYLNGWSRINCPFCDCPNAHSSIKQGCTVVERSGNTEISNCLGFDHTDFIICYLHLLERIIQHLLRLSLGTAEENFDSMVKEIQMVSTLRNLMFEPDENGDYNLYLTGDQCEALLQGRAKFFKNCPKHIQELWNEGNHILDIFKKGLSNGDYQDFQLSLDRFFQKFKKYSTIGSCLPGSVFIPESETFPSFDYAIIMYKEKSLEIFLKQSTISTVESHYCHSNGKTDVDNLLERLYVLNREGKAMKRKQNVPEQYHFSLLELILHGIVGSEETKVELLQARKDDPKLIKDGKLENSVTYGDVEFTWHYIYESGVEEQSVKNVKENGILFRNRQEIEDQMKIYFEK
ncbi:predicted protein [Naegleria gruberi]|uniref:Predicted protein n=1 Tax=Naegleria gruberi TaxID=5762 RepID=D2W569_NAEGR|nr:uncharacterized protein NAEGRDRAFT_76558 [Naegleria gruberi]EFC35781.1 predicted protein [Naegleria gruberi]|eukprot:XP_002668525.1 predicted protein [Naegleria gruberi strain NEG-M]